MTAKKGITGLIMAGGQSKRMGQNKAFLKLNGEFLIKLIISKIKNICQEVFIVVNEKEEYMDLGLPVLQDEIPLLGPLGGLLTGLRNASYDTCLMVATDMPFINIPLLKEMADMINGYDVVIPKNERGLEPLHACYSKKCLPLIEKSIQSGQRRIISFFNQARVKTLKVEEWKSFDQEGLFFFNINNKEDLNWAETLINKALDK